MDTTVNQKLAAIVGPDKTHKEATCAYDAEHGYYVTQEDKETHIVATGKPVNPTPFEIKR